MSDSFQNQNIQNVSTNFHNENKQPFQKLLPGGCSNVGFLRPGQNLDVLIEEDRRILRSLGVTQKDMGNLLFCFSQAGLRFLDEKGKGKTVDIPPTDVYGITLHSGVKFRHFVIGSAIFLGSQECPWGCKSDHAFGRCDFVVYNTRTKESLVFPQLIIHLIRKHCFFEGGPYRVEPERVVRVLNMRRHTRYKAKFKRALYWESGHSLVYGGKLGKIQKFDENRIIGTRNLPKKLKLAPKLTLFFNPESIADGVVTKNNSDSAYENFDLGGVKMRIGRNSISHWKLEARTYFVRMCEFTKKKKEKKKNKGKLDLTLETRSKGISCTHVRVHEKKEGEKEK